METPKIVMTMSAEIAALRLRAAGAGQIVSLGEKPPYPIVTTGMDQDWKERFDRQYPTPDGFMAGITGQHFDTDFVDISMKRETLIQGLLRMAGDRALLSQHEPDLDRIIERGQLFSAEGLIEKPGEARNCHANAARLWLHGAGSILLASGYYLCTQGMWRSHSWCIEPAPLRPRVIETTEPAAAYFGFAMTVAEAREFARMNIRPDGA